MTEPASGTAVPGPAAATDADTASSDRTGATDAGDLAMTIIMPVHASNATTTVAMRAARAALGPADELIVVVDGPDEALPAEAAALADRVVVLDEGRGPAAARNEGARVANGEVLLFVDSDVVIARLAVDAARAVFDDAHVAGVIGSYDDDPSDPGVASRYKNLLHHHVHQRAAGPTETFWGACGAIRADVFAGVGGFDPWYAQPSIEDIELGYRLTDAGHRLVLDPDIQVTHLKRWTLGNLVETDLLRRALPWAQLLLARGRWHDTLNIDRAARQKVALTSVAALAAAVGAITGRRGTGVAAAAAVVAPVAAADRALVAMLRRAGGPWFALRAYALHLGSYLLSAGAMAWALGRRARGALDVPPHWTASRRSPG